MITICCVYFRSLGLANLAAALYSIRCQDLSQVSAIIIVDNNTDDTPEAIGAVIEALNFPVPVSLHSVKHGDPTRTHAWSTNLAISLSETPWIFFTRADYILDFNALFRFMAGMPAAGFITGRVRHLQVGIDACEATTWRQNGTGSFSALPGVEEDYMAIDAGVWLIRREDFDRAGGLDERLTAWGHAQTHFQWKLHQAGAIFYVIAEPLFFHPFHGAERDINVAHEQLTAIGVDIREMWARYNGVSPYGSAV